MVTFLLLFLLLLFFFLATFLFYLLTGFHLVLNILQLDNLALVNQLSRALPCSAASIRSTTVLARPLLPVVVGVLPAVQV